MKILMLGELPPKASGIALHVYNLTRALRSLKVDVISVNISDKISKGVINITKSPSKKMILKSFFELFFKYPINFPKFFVYTLKNIFFRGPRIYYWTSKILKIINTHNNIEIIHSHSMPAAYICDLLIYFNKKFPKILTLHGNDIIILPKIPRYKNPVLKSYKRMDSIITVSKELAELTKQYVKNEVNYIPNGVDIEQFNPDVDNIEYIKKFKDNNTIILSPRQFWVKYGYEILVRSAPYILKEVPNLKILLTGNPDRDPQYSERLFKLSKDLGVFDSIILVGWINYEDMPKLYSIADVVAFPSLAEAVCLTALEAMAVEKPIVSTAVGGFPEIIKDSYNGYVVDIVGKSSQYTTAFSIEEEKIKLFANKIIDLLKDKDKRELMGKRSREIVKKSYTWIKIAQKTLNVYKNVLKKVK